MKKIGYIALLSLSIAATSCVGKKEPAVDYMLSVSASQPNVSVDNNETIKIRVKNNSVDVTDQAEIYYIDGANEVMIPAGEFTATESGEYTIHARYNDYESESATTVCAYTDEELSEEYYRRHVIMKFTATWCSNCPAMGEAITEVEHSMPHRIVEMAIHSTDELEADDSAELVDLFGCNSLPTTITNFNATTKNVVGSPVKIKESVDKAPAAVSGVRLKTSIEGGKLNIEAGVTATEANEYKLAVAVVMDGYQLPQTGATYANYKQNKVLKYYATNPLGDALALTVGEESVVNFSETLPSEATTSECRVIAYVLNKQEDGSFIVNNATECVAGESIDYMFELK